MFPGVGAAAGLYWGTEEVTSAELTAIQAKWTLGLKLSYLSHMVSYGVLERQPRGRTGGVCCAGGERRLLRGLFAKRLG